MEINIIKVENKKLLAFKLPSKIEKDDKNIGNKLEDFEILQVLGQGGFGFVAKVRSKNNSRIYALKKYNTQNLNEEEKKEFKKEVIFSKKLDHPNVCKFLESFEEDGNNYYVMKLFNNKDLYHYLSGYIRLNILISEDILWEIFYKCLDGLTYLHKQGVIHRDLKLGNIFMDEKRNVIIGDYGTCAVMGEKEAKKFTNDPEDQSAILINYGYKVGTQYYMAPEVEFLQKYDQRADVFSLGSTFYILCYFVPPYHDGYAMVEMMNDNNFYSYELKNIIYKMILVDKNERPTSFDIVKTFKKRYIKIYVNNSGI